MSSLAHGTAFPHSLPEILECAVDVIYEGHILATVKRCTCSRRADRPARSAGAEKKLVNLFRLNEDIIRHRAANSCFDYSRTPVLDAHTKPPLPSAAGSKVKRCSEEVVWDINPGIRRALLPHLLILVVRTAPAVGNVDMQRQVQTHLSLGEEDELVFDLALPTP